MTVAFSSIKIYKIWNQQNDDVEEDKFEIIWTIKAIDNI